MYCKPIQAKPWFRFLLPGNNTPQSNKYSILFQYVLVVIADAVREGSYFLFYWGKCLSELIYNKMNTNNPNLAQCQILFYKHKEQMVPDYCTKYEQNHCTLLWHITKNTNKNMIKLPWVITQIWHRAKFYFMCISSPWYKIMVPNTWRKSIQPQWRNGWTDRPGQFLYSPIPLLRKVRNTSQWIIACLL